MFSYIKFKRMKVCNTDNEKERKERIEEILLVQYTSLNRYVCPGEKLGIINIIYIAI